MVALGGVCDGKAVVVVSVSKALTERLHAGQVAAEIANDIGAHHGGGLMGKADAIGDNISGLVRAMEHVYEIVARVFA